MATFVIFLLSLTIAITTGHQPFLSRDGNYRSMGPGHNNYGLPAKAPIHQNFYGAVHNHFSQDQQRHHDHGRDQGRDQGDDTIYRFQIGDHFGAYEYIDKTDGYLKGFHIELLQAVCKQAGKKCHYILDAYSNCWNTKGGLELPGIGLQSKWYDGCMGLFPTPERLNSFNFTVSFTKHFKAILSQKAGGVISADLSGQKIGFVEGWAVSKNCLSRQPQFTGEYVDVHYATHNALMDGFKNAEVDAVMTVNAFDAAKLTEQGATIIQVPFLCTTGGSAIMTPYGSEVLDWWNDAFAAFRASGDYAKLCRESASRHGAHGELFCLD